ncbi:hypothetical protein GCM10010315_36680 [Streptomyces luteosporeus]|uniref:DUF2510 domain-containing protein n=1 Tax=Streptomyces luteosporeus TaxID=173856 RepID=A0ABP6G8Z0_9ACTN
MANQLLIFDGKTWLDRTPQAFDGTSWRPVPPLYWDGAEWRSEARPPREFPSHSTSISAITGGDLAELSIPPDVRTNDILVSICAHMGGEARYPRLLSPAGVVPTVYTLRSGIRFTSPCGRGSPRADGRPCGTSRGAPRPP